MILKCRKYLFIFLLILILGSFGISSAKADTLNQQNSFFVSSIYDIQERSQISASVRLVSDHAYFYVEDDYWNSLSSDQRIQIIGKLQTISNEFDSRIYPITTNFFGSEPNPGIDGDTRITVLLSRLKSNIGGYFDTLNEIKKSIESTSNAREMLVVNIQELDDSRKLYSFLSHEFQHLITYNQKELIRKISDDVWTNELRSEYAVTLLGYNDPFSGSNLEKRAIGYIRDSSDSLTEWKNLFADYGQIGLFGEYLAQNYSSKVISDLINSNSTGVLSVDEALSKNGTQKKTEVVFGDWAIANIVNDKSFGDAYYYSRLGMQNLRIVPTQTISNFQGQSDFSISLNAKDWEARWYDFNNILPSGTNLNQLNFKFDSTSISSFRVAYAIFGNDGSKKVGNIRLSFEDPVLKIPDVGTKISRIILIPYKTDKLAGFSSNEPSLELKITVSRTIIEPGVSDKELLNNTTQVTTSVSPEQFNLKEGDFIRAEGDNQVYIINQFGYKRPVLSPSICLLYRHLGDRGCFGAINIVSNSTRDAFITSRLFTNGEIKDNKIFELIETGEDTGYLKLVSTQFDNSVFYINNLEQKAYQR